jgi:hypothetical protein
MSEPLRGRRHARAANPLFFANAIPSIDYRDCGTTATVRDNSRRRCRGKICRNVKTALYTRYIERRIHIVESAAKQRDHLIPVAKPALSTGCEHFLRAPGCGQIFEIRW